MTSQSARRVSGSSGHCGSKVFNRFNGLLLELSCGNRFVKTIKKLNLLTKQLLTKQFKIKYEHEYIVISLAFWKIEYKA